MIIQPTSIVQQTKFSPGLALSQPHIAARATNPADIVTISQAARDAFVAAHVNAAPTASPQSTPTANNSVTGSSAGADVQSYELQMAQRKEGLNYLRTEALRNSTAAWAADFAFDLAHDNLMIGSPIGGLVVPGATPNDPVTYVSGAPVTVASQAYFTQHATRYQRQVLQLYNTETEKGTTAGQIINDIFDLQAEQPAAFRSMMMWPPGG